MNFALNFLKGLIVGIGAIAPGLSGGSLAVMFGIYEKLTGLISNLFKNLKQNLMFYISIGLGIGIGILGFSKVMEYLFANYNAPVKYLFIGLIIGTFPSVFRQANLHGFKKIYVLMFVISFGLTILLAGLNSQAVSVMEGKTNLLWLLIYGAILGFGTIIPGISSSFILMYLGAYELLLSSVARFDLPLLIPMGVGFLLSIFIFAKFISLLFKHAYGYTYYMILGFVIGSIIPIFPGFALRFEYVICVILLIIGFFMSYFLGRYEKKRNARH